MNRKILGLIVATSVQGFWGHQSWAGHNSGSDNASGYKHKAFQPYLGLSGGIDKLTGKHKDSLIEPNGIPVVVYSSNQTLPTSGQAVSGSAIAGFLVDIPCTPIAVGPEVYIGHSNATSNFRYAYNDSAAGEDRVYTSALKRNSFYGLLLRGGVSFCQEYFAYLSIGADFSNFSINRSLEKDTAIPDTHTSVVKSNKNFRGALYGLGLEKRFHCLKIGFDFKGIRFEKNNFSDVIPTTTGIGGGITSLNYTTKPNIYSFTLRLSYLL